MSRPYFGLRKYRRQIAELEAEGKTFWTENLVEATRVKLVHAVGGLIGDPNYIFEEKTAEVARLVSSQAGIISLSHEYNLRRSSSVDEVLNAILTQSCQEAIVFSLLEAIWDVAPHYPGNPELSPRTKYAKEIRTVFEDCRVSYDFVEGNIIPRSEQIMHTEVVVPALTLLSGRRRFKEAERRFFEALKSIQDHRFDDAITDAAAALEATLDSLDCEGNTLGKKAKIAQTMGMITSYDHKLIDWLSADRVSKGDPHSGDGETTRDDAWLTIHITGAVILRLASGEVR